MGFVLPYVVASKSRDTFKRPRRTEEDNEEIEIGNPPTTKKKSIAEKKLDLLSKCTDALASSSKKSDDPSAMSAFGMYIEEKLSQLEKRNRRIAEKRITDILFEIEIAEESREYPPVPPIWNQKDEEKIIQCLTL